MKNCRWMLFYSRPELTRSMATFRAIIKPPQSKCLITVSSKVCALSRRDIFDVSHLSIHSSAKMNGRIVVENVPGLGESITEGSIARWEKKVGDKVSVDDVLVVVETDKVTVDIKALAAGRLTKQLATDKVVVGGPLYEIDYDSSSATTAAASSGSASSTNTDNYHGDHSRHPLIKFLGKRSKTQIARPTVPASSPTSALSQPTQAPAKTPKPVAATVKKPSGKAVDFATLKGGAQFGRPKLTSKEMEAIESGGADY